MVNEGDLVLCTVEKIEGPVVFVQIDNGEQGTIISSEIAPGRIKNMRQYVVPNKKIVCKVLKVSDNGKHIELSLRRVGSKEKSEVLKEFKQKQTIKSAFKQILPEENTKKILKDYETFQQFLDATKENKELLKKYIPKDKLSAIEKITEKRKKNAEIFYKIKLKCLEDNGIKKIKEIFKELEETIKVTYLSAGNFRIKITAQDFKKGKQKATEIIKELEQKAKSNKCEFSSEEI